MEAEGRAERPRALGAAEKERSSPVVGSEISRLGYMRWGRSQGGRAFWIS